MSETKKPFSEDVYENVKAQEIFRPLNSADELRDWMDVYFDIRFPKGVVYPTSTHGPVDAMWRIYELFKTGKTADVPQVVMVSARDAYKCSQKGSLLITKTGMKRIEDVKVGEVIWSGFSWQKVTDWVDDGIKNGIKIKTRKGNEFVGTPIHRYWALRDGVEQWIKSKDLNPDTDLICVNNTAEIDFKLDQDKFDVGYFLGLLIGDGNLTFLKYEKYTPFFCLTTVDENIKNFFFDFCIKKWGYEPKLGTDKVSYRVTKKAAVETLLNEYGVKPTYSYQKTVPDIVWTDRSIALGFVNGVFDTDGSFEKSKKNMIFQMSAETLLKEMQTLLLSLGVVSGFRKAKKLLTFKDPSLKQNHLTCSLTINSHEVLKLQKLGFHCRSKKAGKIHIPDIPDAHDTIPWSHLSCVKDIFNIPVDFTKTTGRKHKTPLNKYRSEKYKGVNVDKLAKYILWVEESIELGGYHNSDVPRIRKNLNTLKSLLKNKWMPFSKEEVSDVHFFDLTVENDHSYWSNGSISHNTLSASAIEVLLFLHFRLPMAHAAAIKFQAGAAVKYVNTFFRKVQPYLIYHGWKKTSDNKTLIEWQTNDGDEISLTVLTASREGMNSRHVPLLCVGKNTMISTTNGPVKIKHLYQKHAKGKQLPKVLTYNHKTETLEYKDILWAWSGERELFKISFTNNTSITAGSNHKFFCENKKSYAAVKDLSVGDIVKTNNSTTAIVGIESVGMKKAYDLTIADNHNYYANQILTHNCLDELDLMDPAAFSESRLVPSVYKNFSPLIIILSTRKFAAGLMEQEIERTPTIGGEVFKWNIIDVASAIPPEISRPDLPKVERYVTSKLPMSNLSPAQFSALSADEQAKYDQFFAYAGIAEHPLLPVMRNYLADRNQEDSGGLYKPLTAVHNNFKLAHDPDWAEAQLLGNKPTSSGLVYPRFEVLSNTISIVDMYEKIMGEEAPEDLDIEGLRTALVGTGIEFIGGADWGYTDYTSLVVIAITPTGDAYIVDNYLSPQLELDDIAVAMGELDRAWGVTKWYVDQAYPAYIATLRRKGFKLPEFTKNVGDGIAAVQYKICDSTGKRRLFVLDTPNTHDVIKSFGQYRWSINNKGEVIEGKPYHGRDNGGISDIQDSIRYPFQVLFSKSGKKPTATVATQAKPERITFGASAEEIKQAHSNQLMSHVHGGNIPKPVTHTPSTPQAPENTGQKKKKGVFWSI